jgi:hypothetical protein
VIECGSLEFAQARLQARHGQRASEVAWQRLETAREFGLLLGEARASPLRPWIVGLTAQATSNEIEAVLRAHWRALVAEVANWMPPEWRPALDWCAVLPELQALQHLARGGEPGAWMHDDPDLRTLCGVPMEGRRTALAVGRLGALARAWSAPSSLGHAWRREWERRLPHRVSEADESLRQVVAALRSHGAAFAAAPPGPGGMLRRSLQARLALLLRRATLEPAAAFIHIALGALDLERLRGELLRRALFPNARVA